VHFDAKLILIAFVTAILLSFLGSLYPAWRASRIAPIVGLKE
jgi:ABC-type lipoprotein release transport system permease subunit